jgi:hypothetical protein
MDKKVNIGLQSTALICLYCGGIPFMQDKMVEIVNNTDI